MEQLKQLIEMRDAAQVRLEAARRAIEESPDAKLVSQLSPVIETLAASFGVAATAAPQTSAVTPEKSEDIANDLEKALSGVGGKEEAVESNAAPDDFSLEDSLEAELLKGGGKS